MAQVLKETVKQQILETAETLFAKQGYQKTTMAGIAKQAGISTGNTYKYFAKKDDLFYSIITPEFVNIFNTLTSNRVDILVAEDGVKNSPLMTTGEAGELLKFWIDNRFKVIILLTQATGSEYENFGQEYIQAMYTQSIARLPDSQPQLALTDMFLFTFREMLSNTVLGISRILDKYDNESDISDAFALSWRYHRAGIQALIDANTL